MTSGMIINDIMSFLNPYSLFISFDELQVSDIMILLNPYVLFFSFSIAFHAFLVIVGNNAHWEVLPVIAYAIGHSTSITMTTTTGEQ